jgi:hypothetical protein
VTLRIIWFNMCEDMDAPAAYAHIKRANSIVTMVYGLGPAWMPNGSCIIADIDPEISNQQLTDRAISILLSGDFFSVMSATLSDPKLLGEVGDGDAYAKLIHSTGSQRRHTNS